MSDDDNPICREGICQFEWQQTPAWDEEQRLLGLTCHGHIERANHEFYKLAFLIRYKEPGCDHYALFAKTQVSAVGEQSHIKGDLLVFIPNSLDRKRLRIDAVATVQNNNDDENISYCFHKEHRFFDTKDPCVWEQS